MSGETEPAAVQLTPESRARPGATGTPVAIGGATWLLADFVPAWDGVWDDLFDQNQLDPEYDPDDVRKAGLRLLWANYELSAEEAVRLTRLADTGDLARAAEVAMFGPEGEHNTYGDWANASLWANAIDPGALPPRWRRVVLDLLVKTGRTVPPAAFVSSAEFVSYRRGLLSVAAQTGR